MCPMNPIPICTLQSSILKYKRCASVLIREYKPYKPSESGERGHCRNCLCVT